MPVLDVLLAGLWRRDRDEAHPIADRFRRGLTQRARFRGRSLTVGASIGVTASPAGDPDRLLHAPTCGCTARS
jgi:GGDEF domain-containing protein